VRAAEAAPFIGITVEGVKVPPWRPRLAAFCATVVRTLGLEGSDLSILLCGDARMTELNARYRAIARPTDVLSFSRRAAGGLAGDLAISLETLERNAAAYGVSQDEELRRLAIHGILHLAGMDHGRGKGRTMMRAQSRLLKQLEGERIIR
jgi:probable rRNA maturation factor